jgi:hypothetical protein
MKRTVLTTLGISLKIIFIVLSIADFSRAYAQVFPSNCDAADSVKAKYQNDADKLALRKILRQGSSSEMDSVNIPRSSSDAVMRALMALYNAKDLPARDTIISLLNIHPSVQWNLKAVYIEADSSLGWMHELRSHRIPCGNASLDSLLQKFNLKVDSYDISNRSLGYDEVNFLSAENYNTMALASLMQKVPGIEGAYPELDNRDGPNVYDTIYPDHVDLTYYYGWSFCYEGCVFKHYWKLRVDSNCNVEYYGNYGDQLDFLTDVRTLSQKKFSLSPNPFRDYIQVRQAQAPFKYSFENLLGEEVSAGTSWQNSIDARNLRTGVYIMKIWQNGIPFSEKVIKE